MIRGLPQIKRVLVVLAFEWHLILFSLLGFLFHPSLGWGVGIFSATLLWFSIQSIGVNFGSYANAKNALAEYLNQFRRFELIPVDPGFVIDAATLAELPRVRTFGIPFMRRRLPPIRDFEPVRLFVVNCPDAPRPASFKSYCTIIGTSFIFLRKPPRDLTNMDLFRLYHELAHVSAAGIANWFHLNCDYLHIISVAGLIVAALTTNGIKSPWLWAAVTAYAVVFGWIKTLVAMAWGEALADVFSLSRLKGRINCREIVGLHERVWEPLIKRLELSPLEGVEKIMRIAAMRGARDALEAGQPVDVGWNVPMGWYAALPVVLVAVSAYLASSLSLWINVLMWIVSFANLWASSTFFGKAVLIEAQVSDSIWLRARLR